MVKDNLHFDAQERLKSGIKKVARAVGVTMGTAGSNAIIETLESPGHILTNDGYSIANAIILTDPVEDKGRTILLEAINRANKASGDGSSTTCVLTDAILDVGWKHVGEAHPMAIKRSLEDCVSTIEDSLEEQKKVIDVKDVGQVATVSSEDSAIGARIQEIYERIGKSGIIHWDISKTTEDSFTIGEGITVEGATYISPYMCDATEGGGNSNQIRLSKPKILITSQKISSAVAFADLAASLDADGVKDLIVFAGEVDPLVVPDLIMTRARRGFRIAIVKMPVLWRDWWYEDLAKATGATIIDGAGLFMKDAKKEHLGTVNNILITREDTFLDGIKDVTQHISEIESGGTDSDKLRASRLNTKTARYYVGAQSDSALSYRRLKVEDAISAAWQALNGGIVAGGGTALLNVSARLKQIPSVGAKILAEALEAPARQIYANTGIKAPDIFDYDGTDKCGFDSRLEREVPDMFKQGIVDPKNVVLNAVKNAVSVAATVLTAPTLVLLPREEAEPVSPSNLIVR